jgi:aminoglycoside 2''-phosphotransferase
MMRERDPRYRTLTEADVADLIAWNLPSLRVESITYLGAGDFCVAFLVNDQWVFRFARHKAAAAALRRETCVLPRLSERLELQIPHPEFVHLDAATPFIGYAFLPGSVLTRDRCLNLTERELEWCAEQLARFLTQLHSTNLATVDTCGLESIYDRDYFRRVLNDAQQFLFPKLPAEDRSYVERFINEFLVAPDPPGFRSVLLHGDVAPGHVLYDEHAPSLTGIIDFGDVGIGDPAWDFVFLYEDFGVELLCRVVRAYAPEGSSGLLRRMHRLYVLAAIEWAVQAAQHASPELHDALSQLGHLRDSAARELELLLNIG